jgi:hypothetical protein
LQAEKGVEQFPDLRLGGAHAGGEFPFLDPLDGFVQGVAY